LTGKSPICDGDLIEALSVSLEPRFAGAAITASDAPGVRFLLDHGILARGHDNTVTCDKCEEGCELPVECIDGKRVFVCPTGFIERPVAVPDDVGPVYRFDFPAFCHAFAKQNNLRIWTDDGDLNQSLHAVARGRRANKRIAAVYALNLDTKDVTTTMPALKNRLQCDRLIVLAPVIENIDNAIIRTLAAQDIGLVAFDTLLADQTFDLDLAKHEEPAPPSDAYCRSISHEGREFLNQPQYEAMLKKMSGFDLFIDGFQKKVWKRAAGGKIVDAKMTPAELQILVSYIEHGKVAKPARFGSSVKVFETARRKADVKVGRYDWRAFTTHRTPADRRLIEYQFTPPSDLKFCVIIPLS